MHKDKYNNLFKRKNEKLLLNFHQNNNYVTPNNFIYLRKA